MICVCTITSEITIQRIGSSFTELHVSTEKKRSLSIIVGNFKTFGKRKGKVTEHKQPIEQILHSSYESEDNLMMNCLPVRLSNITDPGLHRKLCVGWVNARKRWDAN